MESRQLEILLLRTDHRAELHVSGDVDWNGAEILRQHIASLCEMGFESLVIDVEEATFADRALLSVMLADADGCDFVLRGAAAA